MSGDEKFTQQDLENAHTLGEIRASLKYLCNSIDEVKENGSKSRAYTEERIEEVQRKLSIDITSIGEKLHSDMKSYMTEMRLGYNAAISACADKNTVKTESYISQVAIYKTALEERLVVLQSKINKNAKEIESSKESLSEIEKKLEFTKGQRSVLLVIGSVIGSVLGLIVNAVFKQI